MSNEVYKKSLQFFFNEKTEDFVNKWVSLKSGTYFRFFTNKCSLNIPEYTVQILEWVLQCLFCSGLLG